MSARRDSKASWKRRIGTLVLGAVFTMATPARGSSTLMDQRATGGNPPRRDIGVQEVDQMRPGRRMVFTRWDASTSVVLRRRWLRREWTIKSYSVEHGGRGLWRVSKSQTSDASKARELVLQHPESMDQRLRPGRTKGRLTQEELSVARLHAVIAGTRGFKNAALTALIVQLPVRHIFVLAGAIAAINASARYAASHVQAIPRTLAKRNGIERR